MIIVRTMGIARLGFKVILRKYNFVLNMLFQCKKMTFSPSNYVLLDYLLPIGCVCVRFDGENEILIKKIIFLNEHSALATKDSTRMYT